MRTLNELTPSDLTVAAADAPRFEEWKEAKAKGEEAQRQSVWLAAPAVGLMVASAVVPGIRALTTPLFVVIVVAMIVFLAVKAAPHNRRARALQKELGLKDHDVREALRQ